MSSIIYNKRAYTAGLARGTGRGGVSALGDGRAPPAQKKSKRGYWWKKRSGGLCGACFDAKSCLQALEEYGEGLGCGLV